MFVVFTILALIYTQKFWTDMKTSGSFWIDAF